MDPEVAKQLSALDKRLKSIEAKVNKDTPPVNPVVVTAYREIIIDKDNSDAEYTYSDGTKQRFKWKFPGPDARVAEGDSDNFKKVKSISYSGYCDDRALGMPKTS